MKKWIIFLIIIILLVLTILGVLYYKENKHFIDKGVYIDNQREPEFGGRYKASTELGDYRCEDSDGGMNKEVLGTTKKCYKDECTSDVDSCDPLAEEVLYEYVCNSDGRREAKGTRCENKCENGVCI